jgi:enoyl-CoA hydratase/carnithine racemase
MTPSGRRKPRRTELLLLGASFDSRRAVELGLINQVISDKDVMATATVTARKLTAKPARALHASKRLMKQPFHEQIKAAIKGENDAFSGLVRSEEARWAFRALLEKRKLHFASIV